MIFEILLFGLLAIVLALKLKSILGNEYDDMVKSGRNSNLKDITLLTQRDIPSSEPDVADICTPSVMDPQFFATFSEVAAAFPGITPSKFINVTKDVMHTLLQAYSECDTKTITTLVKKDLADSMIARINASRGKGQSEHILLVKISDAKIVNLSIVAGIVSISVFFVTEQIHYITNSAGDIISGNNQKVNDVSEKWTFVNDISATNNPSSRVWLLSSINDDNK